MGSLPFQKEFNLLTLMMSATAQVIDSQQQDYTHPDDNISPTHICNTKQHRSPFVQ